MLDQPTQPDYSKSISEPVRRALAKRQDAIDQAAAIAKLLLDRFSAMVQGRDGPSDEDVMASLEVVVEKLDECNFLTDAVALTHAGNALMGGDHA